MKLTDNEKRDAIKYLEAGKPLPEKYRFLLFDDDREVELLWNGKSNEVTNVVLPFQTIEQIDEPRNNEKFGNQDTLFDTSGRQITGWTNKLIWGDNKLILSSLKNGPLRDDIERQGGLRSKKKKKRTKRSPIGCFALFSQSNANGARIARLSRRAFHRRESLPAPPPLNLSKKLILTCRGSASRPSRASARGTERRACRWRPGPRTASPMP